MKKIFLLLTICAVAFSVQAQNILVYKDLSIKSIPATIAGTIGFSAGKMSLVGTDYDTSLIDSVVVRESNAPFILGLSNVTFTSVDVDLKPQNANDLYFVATISRRLLRRYHSNSVKKYMENLLADDMWKGKTMAQIIGNIADKGDYSNTVEELLPGEEYVAFAMGINTQGQFTTDTLVVPFRMRTAVSENTFSAQFSNISYNGADVKITATNNDTYYYTFRSKAWTSQYANDKDLLDAVATEDAMVIPAYVKSGNIDVPNDETLYTDRDYELLIFGYDMTHYVPSTRIYRFAFRTAAAGIDPATVTYTSKVDKIGPRSASVSVTPSNEKVMYYWDLIPDTDYQKLHGDMTSYANQVLDHIGRAKLADQALYRGESEFNYNYVLDPATTYHIWVAAISEKGTIVGTVKSAGTLTTAQGKVSKTSASLHFDKFYDGTAVYDALHDSAPWKYTEDLKGRAYVPVTMVKSQSPKPMRTRAIAATGDFTDENDITDEQIIKVLQTEGYNWEGTMGISVPYDEDVTFMAVAMDSDGNYSKVFRKKARFNPIKASPISDLTGSQAPPAKVKLLKTISVPKAYKLLKVNE